MARAPRDRDEEHTASAAVRIDKWLWAARFFKSRSLAAEAVTGGRVEINGERVKPSREVKAGDLVRVRLGPYEQRLTVRGASDRRGPAAQAALLYEESADSMAVRESLRWQLRHAAPVIVPGEGRPTKKDRRDLRRLKDS